MTLTPRASRRLGSESKGGLDQGVWEGQYLATGLSSWHCPSLRSTSDAAYAFAVFHCATSTHVCVRRSVCLTAASLHPIAMHRLLPLLIIACAAACRSATEPAASVVSTHVVPAGATDRAWASLGHVCAPDSPAVSISAAQRAASPPFSHGSSRTSDDDWADAARAIPGGVGGYFTVNTVPTMFLVDINQKSSAIALLTGRNLGPVGVAPNSISIVRGRWDFAQLADWYGYMLQYIPPNLSVRDGFILLYDINEAENRIVVEVNTQADRTAVENALRPLNLPCYLAAIHPSAQ